MHILQIVSRVRRQFRRRDPHRRRQQQQQQPPDLRRWSDFENPFPSVSPGGYRRYYETHGGTLDPKLAPLPTALIVASPASSRQSILKPIGEEATPPPHFLLSVDLPLASTSSPSSSSPSTLSPSSLSVEESPPSPSSRRKGKGKELHRLSTIPERPTPIPSAPGLSKSSRRPSNSSVSSGKEFRFRLRRRKGRLLRTPSVVEDLSKWVPSFTLVSLSDPLDGEGYIYLSSASSAESRSHSHGADTPPTTVEDHDLDDLDDDGETLSLVMKGLEDIAREIERSDSKCSFHSAKSEFGGDEYNNWS